MFLSVLNIRSFFVSVRTGVLVLFSMADLVPPHHNPALLVAALENYQAENCGQPFETVTAHWAEIVIDAAGVHMWNPEQSRQGLMLLEQLSRSVAAVKLVLINQLDTGRDTTAAIVRATGVSTRQARELRNAAQVIDQLPEALNNLENGSLSTEHLAKVSGLKPELAAELLHIGNGRSVDDFRQLVDETRVQRNSASVSEEQHNSRCVRIYKKRNGCVGINIVLPPIEGNEFINTLDTIADHAWRTANPERNPVAHVNEIEPQEQRLADAFISWMRSTLHEGTSSSGKPAIIVVIDAETLNAHIVPNQPIPINDALTLAARADMYTAIRDGTNMARLTFGRNKRVASPLQRLALLVQSETCEAPGCTVAASRCDVHHVTYFEHGGLTNLDNLKFYCRGTNGHHPHEHETNRHPETNRQAA
jgi:hypothetical protein